MHKDKMNQDKLQLLKNGLNKSDVDPRYVFQNEVGVVLREANWGDKDRVPRLDAGWDKASNLYDLIAMASFVEKNCHALGQMDAEDGGRQRYFTPNRTVLQAGGHVEEITTEGIFVSNMPSAAADHYLVIGEKPDGSLDSLSLLYAQVEEPNAKQTELFPQMTFYKDGKVGLTVSQSQYFAPAAKSLRRNRPKDPGQN